MDLRTWLLESHADLQGKLLGSVLHQVPVEVWPMQADDGGSSITYLALHLARHHDLALTTVIRDHAPLFESHRSALGLADAGPAAGLTEREDRAVTEVVGSDALTAYVLQVFEASADWIEHLSALALDTIPDAPRRLEEHAHLPTDELDWLYRMWSGKTVAWFVQWPVIGHGNAHVGEAISVRNRLGFSPF